jgi:hypothetical protein
MAAKVQLESGHTGQCSLRSPDFSRKIGEGTYIVSEQGRSFGKLSSCQLNSVTRITGKKNGNVRNGNLRIIHCEIAKNGAQR